MKTTDALTMAQLIDAYATQADSSTMGRLDFFRSRLGDLAVEAVTPDDVDAAMTALARRGKLRAVRGQEPTPTGEPLSGASLNRALNVLAGVFKFARRNRLVPRSFTPPTRGYDKAPEPIDPDRYVDAGDFEKLVQCARVVDRRWKRLPALLVVAYTTGLRKGSIMGLRWRDVDFEARTVSVAKTKNGRPIICGLTRRAADELERLSGRRDPDALIFGNDAGKPFHYSRLLERACVMAGIGKRGLHQLRHGFGTALARAGVPQATISALLGHADIGSSYRYVHHSTADRLATVDRVFV